MGGSPGCAWCRSAIAGRRDSIYCGRKCRQAAWRVRSYSSVRPGKAVAGSGTIATGDCGCSVEVIRDHCDDKNCEHLFCVDTSPGARGGSERRLRLAYADPPYPGTARKYYRGEASFAGEVDHEALIRRLASTYDGWALSTSARSLRELLPLCPPGVRVCAWVKPGGAPPATYGLHNVWEALIVLQGRRLRPGRRDALYIHPARFGGELPGRKPLKFCAWLFGALGALPSDDFEDLYPGSGVVGRAWSAFCRSSRGDE